VRNRNVSDVTVVEKTISSFPKATFWIEKSVSEEKRARMTVTGDSYKGKCIPLITSM
jgi:hypothetical protein